MGAYRGFPDINGFYAMLYGTAGVDLQSLTFLQYGGASGVVFPGNPCYTVTDFLALYPKFFGPSTGYSTLVVTSGSDSITGFTSTAGLAPGQLVVDDAFPKDTLVKTVGSTSITVTNVAAANGTTLTVYQKPFVPIIVILTYVFLARASVMYARYSDAWFLCMSLFIAHYLTLYMRSESGPNETASEVAASGLTKGILISRHAGDVGASSQIILGYEQWGAWTETQYGEQFITIARAANCGPVYVP